MSSCEQPPLLSPLSDLTEGGRILQKHNLFITRYRGSIETSHGMRHTPSRVFHDRPGQHSLDGIVAPLCEVRSEAWETVHSRYAGPDVRAIGTQDTGPSCPVCKGMMGRLGTS